MRDALVKTKTALPAHVVKDRVVQRLLEAEKALGVAVGIDQVRLVMDVAAAQEVFAKRQKLGEEVIGQAHTLKTRALARLGELLQTLPKATNSSGLKRGPVGSRVEPTETTTLADLGVSKKLASVAQQLAALPVDTREAIAQRETLKAIPQKYPIRENGTRTSQGFLLRDEVARRLAAFVLTPKAEAKVSKAVGDLHELGRQLHRAVLANPAQRSFFDTDEGAA